jgi:hypothetical protein
MLETGLGVQHTLVSREYIYFDTSCLIIMLTMLLLNVSRFSFVGAGRKTVFFIV